ncbi:LysR family transcriptional regulator [Ramlibacter alkalitolerans]|uniref:LysR family transcriptional regulator n=1 Tax=Ramlibacter alkalitolerans TaxID=2039631 RepID=A0ABS1JNZ8_9BURK|nr:LysR family transcriptional regulator [Ramlibacter alkalitolerans]MBL0425983.1 LysR family transcriptional regulator [Ramlibacter alkalitolerans]
MSEPLIELRLWRQFLAVAEELHFGRAARGLHMTQPPLTQGIAQLERLLGARLFERTKRSVRLTPAGEALLPQVRELLSRAQGLPAQARAAAGGELGRLRIAFVSTVGFALLPQWLRAFRARHPQVQMELIEATGDVQMQAFARGEIDAGFMLHSPDFAPAGLAHLRVASEPLVLALPDAHALARAARLSLGGVLDEPLVIFPRRIVPSLHDAIFGMYHAAGREPRIAQEAIQMQTIVNLVAAGLGLAWVPESVRQFQRTGVTYRQLAGKQGASVPSCETTLVWSTMSPVLERFVECVRA